MKDKKNKDIISLPEKDRKLSDQESTEIVREEDETSIYEYDLPCLKSKGHLKRK